MSLINFDYDIILPYNQPKWNQTQIFVPNFTHTHMKQLKLAASAILEHISNTDIKIVQYITVYN